MESKRLKIGDTFLEHGLKILQPHSDGKIGLGDLPAPGPALTHIQFRRFAGCPIDDQHLATFTKNKDGLVKAGIQEMIVFHSTPEEILKYESNLPFPIILDPTKILYARNGVGSKGSSMASASLMASMPKLLFNTFTGIVSGKRKAPPMTPNGGQFGLPVDVLVSPEGKVLDIKYGTHPNDQWSLQIVLDKVAMLSLK